MPILGTEGVGAESEPPPPPPPPQAEIIKMLTSNAENWILLDITTPKQGIKNIHILLDPTSVSYANESQSNHICTSFFFLEPPIL